MRDQIVFEGEPELQGQSHHKAGTGRTKRFALRMRKNDHAECVFAGLETYCGEVADFRFLERILKAGEGAGGAHGQRLRSLINIADGEEPALTVGPVADVFPRAAGGEDLQEFGRESE